MPPAERIALPFLVALAPPNISIKVLASTVLTLVTPNHVKVAVALRTFSCGDRISHDNKHVELGVEGRTGHNESRAVLHTARHLYSALVLEVEVMPGYKAFCI